MGVSKAKTELLLTYIGALDARALRIHAGPNGQGARLSLDPDPDLDLFDMLWFAKSQHAELVLMHCPHDWVQSPAALRDEVVNAAAALGATWRTQAEIMETAADTVAEVERHVAALNVSGGLTAFNKEYKSYRLAMQSTGEPAMNYSAYLHKFKVKMVRIVGENVAKGADKLCGLTQIPPGSLGVFKQHDQFGDTPPSSRTYVNRSWSNHSFRKY